LPPPAVVGDELAEPLAPEDVVLPWAFTGAGRGLLFGLAVLGLASFFLPWAHELAPERRTLSGPELAMKLGTMWAPFVAFFVTVPLVATRRTLAKMRGARVAVGFLAAMSAIASLTRIVFPPQGTRIDPHTVQWGIGLYASFAISLAVIGAAVRFGGKPAAFAGAKSTSGGRDQPTARDARSTREKPAAPLSNAEAKTSAPTAKGSKGGKGKRRR
jgi:hypothetical protein